MEVTFGGFGGEVLVLMKLSCLFNGYMEMSTWLVWLTDLKTASKHSKSINPIFSYYNIDYTLQGSAFNFSLSFITCNCLSCIHSWPAVLGQHKDLFFLIFVRCIWHSECNFHLNSCCCHRNWSRRNLWVVYSCPLGF